MVISIIGILSSVAIPAYQDYTGKAQFIEGLTLTAPLKEAVIMHYGLYGICPNNRLRSYPGISQAQFYQGRLLAGIQVSGAAPDCLIQSVFRPTKINAALMAKVVTLTADMSGATVNWKCTTNVVSKLRAAGCEDGSATLAISTFHAVTITAPPPASSTSTSTSTSTAPPAGSSSAGSSTCTHGCSL